MNFEEEIEGVVHYIVLSTLVDLQENGIPLDLFLLIFVLERTYWWSLGMQTKQSQK